MAQNITLMGASYSNVPAVQLPKTGGGTARFDDASVTTAAASDVASGKVFLAADGTITTGTASGGGGVGTLLATKSLGAISTSNTTAEDTGQTVTVSNINSYDALLVETSVDTQTNGRHTCTCVWIWLTASSNVNTKSGATIATAKMNMKRSSNGTTTTRSNTTSYGVYPNSCSLSNGTATLPIYKRYNSTQTGTLNGNYTTRVYGFKLYDMIGG